MNGEVTRITFDNCDDKTKFGIIFDRTEHMINRDEEIIDRLEKIDRELRKQNNWYKIISGIGGFFGGLISSISVLLWRL